MSQFTSNESSTEALNTNQNENDLDQRIVIKDFHPNNDNIMSNSHYPSDGSILDYIK